MPRQARLDTPGTLHHVIIQGIEKRRIVFRMGDVVENLYFRFGLVLSYGDVGFEGRPLFWQFRRIK
jgi:hypothetical protein